MARLKKWAEVIRKDLEKTNWDGVFLVLCVVAVFIVAMLPPDFM